RGPVTAHRLAHLPIALPVIEYIQGKIKFDSLRKMPFSENWLAHLSHAVTSTVQSINPEASHDGIRKDLFTPYSVRETAASGHQKSLNWCESKGVQVLRDVELKDIAFQESNKLASLEIRINKPGLFKAEQFVLC